jgi:hypothetical protein
VTRSTRPKKPSSCGFAREARGSWGLKTEIFLSLFQPATTTKFIKKNKIYFLKFFRASARTTDCIHADVREGGEGRGGEGRGGREEQATDALGLLGRADLSRDNFITDAIVRPGYGQPSGHHLTVRPSVRPSSIVRVTTLSYARSPTRRASLF